MVDIVKPHAVAIAIHIYTLTPNDTYNAYIYSTIGRYIMFKTHNIILECLYTIIEEGIS